MLCTFLLAVLEVRPSAHHGVGKPVCWARPSSLALGLPFCALEVLTDDEEKRAVAALRALDSFGEKARMALNVEAQQRAKARR